MTYGDQHKIMSATQAMHPVPHGATFLTGYFATNDPSNYPSQHMPNLSTAQDPYHEHLHHPGTKTVPTPSSEHRTAPTGRIHSTIRTPPAPPAPRLALRHPRPLRWPPQPQRRRAEPPERRLRPSGRAPFTVRRVFSFTARAHIFAFEPTNPFAPDSDPANLDLLRRTGHGDLPGVGYGGYGAPAYPPHYS